MWLDLGRGVSYTEMARELSNMQVLRTCHPRFQFIHSTLYVEHPLCVRNCRCWGHCSEQQWQIPTLVVFTGSQGFRRTQKSVFLQDSYVILHMKTTDLGAKLLLNPSQFTHTERLIQTKLEFKRKLIPITPQKTQSIFYINWNS